MTEEEEQDLRKRLDEANAEVKVQEGLVEFFVKMIQDMTLQHDECTPLSDEELRAFSSWASQLNLGDKLREAEEEIARLEADISLYDEALERAVPDGDERRRLLESIVQKESQKKARFWNQRWPFT